MRRDGMLLFINVLLGICLGVGISEFVKGINGVAVADYSSCCCKMVRSGIADKIFSDSDCVGKLLQATCLDKNEFVKKIGGSSSLLLVSLFIIYFSNLIRTFLGFVCFYDKEILYSDFIENAKMPEKRKYNERIVDFLFLLLVVLSLAFQSFYFNKPKVFLWIFIVSSMLFVMRNSYLTYTFYYYKRQIVKLCAGENNYQQMYDQSVEHFNLAKVWLLLDIVIATLAIIFLSLYCADVQFLLGACGIVILIIEIIDILLFKEVYFGK